MRMKVRATTLTVAVVAILAISTAAFGAPGGNPGKPGGGGAEHPDGATCAEQSGVVSAAEDGFIVTFTADDPKTACIDWTTTTPSEWTVTVDGADARDFYFNIRDSHPGDFCWLGGLDRKELRAGVTTLVASHTNGELADRQNPGPIPVSTSNACGFEYTDSAVSLVFTIVYKGQAPVTVTVTPVPVP